MKINRLVLGSSQLWRLIYLHITYHIPRYYIPVKSSWKRCFFRLKRASDDERVKQYYKRFKEPMKNETNLSQWHFWAMLENFIEHDVRIIITKLTWWMANDEFVTIANSISDVSKCIIRLVILKAIIFPSNIFSSTHQWNKWKIWQVFVYLPTFE